MQKNTNPERKNLMWQNKSSVWAPGPKLAAFFFIKAMMDPDLTEEQKNRIAEMWNEDARRNRKHAKSRR